MYSQWPRLVRLAFGFTGDFGLAEDLAQTALANAYASWSRLQRADDPDRYLIRILINAHRGGVRRRRLAEAFSRRGEIGYTVPWTGRTSFTTNRWLKPGQPALPRPQTTVIGSGTAFGHSWSELVGVGPWGWCGQGDVDGHGGGGGCNNVFPPLRPGQYYQAAGFAGGTLIGKSGEILGAEVANSVAFIELTTRSGQHSWLRPHRVGGRSFVSFASAVGTHSAPQTVIRWAAYDRHRHLLGTGPAHP